MFFSFEKLDVNLIVNNNENVTNSKQIKIDEVKQGSNLFSSIAVKLAEGSGLNGYVRIKVNYSGEDENSQKTAIALNSILPLEATYSNSTEDYGWQYSGGYLYLTNYEKSALKEMSASEVKTYNLFASGLQMQDLTQFGNNLSTNGVSLQIKAEAVQSSNLQYTDKGETKNVESVEDLEKAINLSNIFGQYTEAGYIVKYDTCGGVSVDSYICLNSDESKVAILPQVGGVDVTWYKDKNFTQLANSTAEESVSGKNYTVTENITLYAKYSGNNNTIKVFFNVNGGDENSTPSAQNVTKENETIEIAIDKTPTKQGYKLSGWKFGATTYAVNNSKITIENTEITTNAIILYAVWEALSYTITFDMSQNEAYKNQLSSCLDSTTNTYKIGYSLADTNLSLPEITTNDENNQYFIGWEVVEAGGNWNFAQIVKAKEVILQMYGDITLKPKWGKIELSFNNSTVIKKLGDADFINSLKCVSTENVEIVYNSSSADIATVDSATGLVHILKVGTTIISASATDLNGKVSTASYTLQITEAKNIKDANVVAQDKEYDSSNSLPSYTITYNGSNLVKDVDYIVITASINVTNTAKLYFIGIGDYVGQKIVEFKITKATLKIEELKATDRFANGKTSVEVSGGKIIGIKGTDNITLGKISGEINTAGAGENKAVRVTAELVGEIDVLQNYNLEEPNVTVTISRPTIIFNADSVSDKGNFSSEENTTLYGEHNSKQLYNSATSYNEENKATAPTFTITDDKYKFVGYFDKDGNQMTDEKGVLLNEFLNSENVTWYVKVQVKLKDFYNTSSSYYNGYVRGSISSDYSTYLSSIKASWNSSGYAMAKSPTEYFSVDESGAESAGNCIAFGYYPQTVKPNETTIDTTKVKQFATFNECYEGDDGYLYVKKKATPTSELTDTSPATSVYNYFSWGSGYNILKKDYYFRIEPIIWKIFYTDETNNVAYLNSISSLFAMPFSLSSKMPYTESDIKPYLNGEFKDSAFVEGTQKSKIMPTTLDTGSFSTSNVNDKTVYARDVDSGDYVFIPSIGDFKTYYNNVSQRLKYASDYAGATGALGARPSKNITSYYWIRTKTEYSGTAACVGENGGIATAGKGVSLEYICVAPALFIQL